jgi:hypothetical protein
MVEILVPAKHRYIGCSYNSVDFVPQQCFCQPASRYGMYVCHMQLFLLPPALVLHLVALS